MLGRRRRSIRLKGYDYSSAGAYFVTVCTKDRRCLFGQILDSKICLTAGGKAAENCWQNIPSHYPQVVLDEHVIMSNHIHGIIVICPNDVGVQNLEPLRQSKPLQSENRRTNKFQQIIPGSLGAIVRGFKIGVTKWFRQNTGIHAVWQRNYFRTRYSQRRRIKSDS